MKCIKCNFYYQNVIPEEIRGKGVKISTSCDCKPVICYPDRESFLVVERYCTHPRVCLPYKSLEGIKMCIKRLNENDVIDKPTWCPLNK